MAWRLLFSRLISYLSENPKYKKYGAVASFIVAVPFAYTEYSDYANGIERDYLKKYTKNLALVEYHCDHVLHEFNASNIAVFAIHDGIYTPNRIHLMRYSSLVIKDTGAVLSKTYNNSSINPFAKYFIKMDVDGYFAVNDMSNDKDIIFQFISKSIDKKGIIYLPIRDKKNRIFAFCTISYTDRHTFTLREAQRMTRAIEPIRMLLLGLEAPF